MKSTLKIAYQNRFGYSSGSKEPVIRFESVNTDDPRDTMLEELINCDSKLGITSLIQNLTTVVGTSPTYFIYKKGPSEVAGDIAFDVFQTLSFEHGNRFEIVFNNGRYYFQLNRTPEYKSNGVMFENYIYLKTEFKAVLIEDFKDFYEKYLHNMNLETY